MATRTGKFCRHSMRSAPDFPSPTLFQYCRYVYCVKCFSEIMGETINVGDDPLTATIIPKSAFKEMKNNSIDRERCVHFLFNAHCPTYELLCGTGWWSVCTVVVRCMPSVCCTWRLSGTGVFNVRTVSRPSAVPERTTSTLPKVSDSLNSILISDSGLFPDQTRSFIFFFFNSFSEELQTSKLAMFLEDRVNSFIRSKDAEDEAGYVTIRVVSSSDKVLETRSLMKDRYSEFPEQFPYRSKAIFAFEEIDGVDVCFFGMHVQEYGSDCQAPNTR